MEIRKAVPADLPRLMEIYAAARAFMAQSGNPGQWGTNWPPEALVRQDIAAGKSYICQVGQHAAGVFFLDYGPDIEPTYERIENGAWRDPSPYGVVHRIASDGSVKGVGSFCLAWALSRCGHLRIDTHRDNLPMRNLLDKLGFAPCGTIYVEKDHSPRLAYEKTVHSL